MPWVNPANIILGRKEGMSAAEFKSSMVTKCNVRLHVEDSFEDALGIVQETNCKVLLVPQPWNLSEVTDDPRIRFLRPYSETSGVWPVLRFLASNDAALFIRQ